MHAIAKDGLHWHRRVGMEAIKVLDWRRVVRIWPVIMPSSMILKNFLMMVFVVHM